MKTSTRFARPRTTLIAALAAFGLTMAVARQPAVLAGERADIPVPDLPDNLQVPEGNKVYLGGHALGTQNYICMPCPNALTPAEKCPASGFAWGFFGPEATLFDIHDGDDHQIITHHNSPNPEEGGKERPSWQHSHDSSIVWGNNTLPPGKSSTDSAFVADGAIPWLLLPMAGTQVGPTGGAKLTKTTFIHRVNTAGGVAPPAETCAAPADAGKKALVPYSADYFFYEEAP